MVPAVEAQSLNHWTAKEVPGFPLFNHSWPSSLPTGETWTRRVTCLPVALMSDRLAHPYSLKETSLYLLSPFLLHSEALTAGSSSGRLASILPSVG